jgi:hypothetical protein
MESVLDGGVRDFIAEYRDEAGFLFNRTAVQVTYAIDRALRRPAAAQPPAEAGGERCGDLVRT